MRMILIGLLLASTAAQAALTPRERYVRFRAAEAAGKLDQASEQMVELLRDDVGSDTLALRAYRQGIASGNRDLAFRAAKLLDGQKALPADAPLLFAIDAIRIKDWKTARAQVDTLEGRKLFAFLAPLLRGWIAVGAGDTGPIDALEPARAAGLASAYYPTARVLILTATGRLDEAVAGLKAQQAAGSRARLLVASALAKAKRIDEAKALLAGDEAVLTEARRRLEAGKPIGLELDGAGGGVSELLTQVAIDFNRQRLQPVAMMMARFASFADPRNASAWIATASLLGLDKKQAAGIEALGHVEPGDPFAEDAKTLRVSLLVDAGDKQGALAAALAGIRDEAAVSADWSRAADVYMSLDRAKEAADCYAKALMLAGDAPAEQLWPILLQQGAALEQAGDWPGAKAALTRALTLAPTQPAVLNHLGYSLLSRREDIAHAATLIAQASRLRPDDPAITDSSGWAHFVTGDIKGALPLLETAAAGNPGDSTINEHLGDVYWTQGRRVEARYAWRAAELAAEDKDLSRLRTKIADGLTKATASP